MSFDVPQRLAEHLGSWSRLGIPHAVGALAGLCASACVYLGMFAPSPAKDFLKLQAPAPISKLQFGTGPRGGRFHEIGQCVDRQKLSFVTALVPTDGSFHNAAMVNTQQHTAALVGKSVVKQEELDAHGVQLVAPVYLQTVQLIYKASAWEATEKLCASGDLNGELSHPPDGRLRIWDSKTSCETEFLRRARWSMGPLRSGTHLFASYLTSRLGVHPVGVAAASFDDELELLEDDRIDVAFIFAGRLELVDKLLQRSKQFRVATLQPNFVPVFTNEYQAELVHAVSDYPGQAGETFGAYACLATSADVTKAEQVTMLRAIANCLTPSASASRPSGTIPDERIALGHVAAKLEQELAEEKRTLILAAVEWCGYAAFLILTGAFGLAELVSRTKRAARLRECDTASTQLEAARSSAIDLRSLEPIAIVLDECRRWVRTDCKNGLMSMRHRDELLPIISALDALLFEKVTQCLAQFTTRAERDAAASFWLQRGSISHHELERLLSPSTASSDTNLPRT